mmetsp:Transcript_77109/g.133714  ORF Transcript_77109/g.133714 Transcript_77109/m.133714 type:complete len:202 (-) Transcript_77109:51-656(-)
MMSELTRSSIWTHPSGSKVIFTFLAPCRRIQESFLDITVRSSSPGFKDIICSSVFPDLAGLSSPSSTFSSPAPSPSPKRPLLPQSARTSSWCEDPALPIPRRWCEDPLSPSPRRPALPHSARANTSDGPPSPSPRRPALPHSARAKAWCDVPPSPSARRQHGPHSARANAWCDVPRLDRPSSASHSARSSCKKPRRQPAAA